MTGTVFRVLRMAKSRSTSSEQASARSLFSSSIPTSFLHQNSLSHFAREVPTFGRLDDYNIYFDGTRHPLLWTVAIGAVFAIQY
jgi:hypothetical protein